MVRYEYDAWGNHKVLDANGQEITDHGHIGHKNPFRYRGYFFDEETGLYYLQTRYYDPITGRFISQDGIDYADPQTPNGINLYAYCANNPVMAVDPTGNSLESFVEWLKNAWNTVKDFVVDTAKSVGNWLSQNWDIVVGAYLVVAGIALSIVTFGAATVIAGVVCGAVLGATFGALSAYHQGENIFAGMINGLLVGATGGINPFAGALTAAGMSFIMDRVNGVKADGSSFIRAITNASIAFALAGLGNGFGSTMIGNETGAGVKIVASFVANFIFSGYSFVADEIKNRVWRSR